MHWQSTSKHINHNIFIIFYLNSRLISFLFFFLYRRIEVKQDCLLFYLVRDELVSDGTIFDETREGAYPGGVGASEPVVVTPKPTADAVILCAQSQVVGDSISEVFWFETVGSVLVHA